MKFPWMFEFIVQKIIASKYSFFLYVEIMLCIVDGQTEKCTMAEQFELWAKLLSKFVKFCDGKKLG